MSKPRKKKRPPKRVLALPDLKQSKAAVLDSLTFQSGERTYDRAINDFSVAQVLAGCGLVPALSCERCSDEPGGSPTRQRHATDARHRSSDAPAFTKR
jgi:hypothetical protein